MDLADRNARKVVHAENRIARKPLEEALFQHAPGATAAAELFCRLKDQHQGAATRQPAIACSLGEHACGAEQHRGMAVVAAAVHLARHGARPGQAGHFLERDRIHIGTQPDAPPISRAPLQHADHAGDGDATVHRVAPCAQLFGNEGAGGMLLEAELGLAVDGVAPAFHLFDIEPCRGNILLAHSTHR